MTGFSRPNRAVVGSDSVDTIQNTRAPLVNGGNAGVSVNDDGTVQFSESGLSLGHNPTGTAAATVLATSGTISFAIHNVQRENPAGAITGVIVASGTYDGQIGIIINESASSITMAAAGTSHVADGTSAVVAALTRMVLVWDSATALWYHGN